MMKPKAALVKDGFVEPNHTWKAGDENKRGRLSLAARKRCEELAGKGWQIEGLVASKPAETSQPVTVERVKNDPNRVLDVPDEHRREEDWTAHAEGNEIGMRTVDNVCGNSLTYCWCPTPKVWIDHNREAVVQFKPRSKPLPTKRWW